MNRKKFTAHFIVLLLPMLIVSTLLYFLYTMNAHEYIQMNWLVIILLAAIFDSLLTWIFLRKEKDNKPNNSLN